MITHAILLSLISEKRAAGQPSYSDRRAHRLGHRREKRREGRVLPTARFGGWIAAAARAPRW